jgi:hypothetical protein
VKRKRTRGEEEASLIMGTRREAEEERGSGKRRSAFA